MERSHLIRSETAKANYRAIDYAEPDGTLVSAVGDVAVIFSGKNGDYGKLVIMKHANGFKTYYGRLSGIGNGISPGVKLKQGGVIRYDILPQHYQESQLVLQL